MAPVLDRYRTLCHSLADAVRWACTLEAVSPKLGNVHPTAVFSDLNIQHFILAGEQLADSCQTHSSVGSIVFTAVENSVQRCGTNVNLGIALLIGPLVTAMKRGLPVTQVLESLTEDDARKVYAAISLANPGGLGKVEHMDVHQPPPSDLMTAMKHAQQRDLIARQYANHFADLFDFVVPSLLTNIERTGDLLWAIRDAQIEILAKYGDSLVERKCGPILHNQLQVRAKELLALTVNRQQAEQLFDQWLRADGNRRNPGTTADMIAAGLFVLLSDGTKAIRG